MYSPRVEERGSSRRLVSPLTQYADLENGWHGGPPANRSASPGRNLASERISSVVMEWMSRLMMGHDLLCLIVRTQSLSISTATRVSKPAASSPRSRPPAPVKRLISDRFLVLF